MWNFWCGLRNEWMNEREKNLMTNNRNSVLKFMVDIILLCIGCGDSYFSIIEAILNSYFVLTMVFLYFRNFKQIFEGRECLPIWLHITRKFICEHCVWKHETRKKIFMHLFKWFSGYYVHESTVQINKLSTSHGWISSSYANNGTTIMETIQCSYMFWR